MRDMIHDGLSDYFQLSTLSIADLPQSHAELAVDQNSIGWYNFLKGRLSVRWRSIQLAYLLSKGIDDAHQKSITWSTQLVSLIWEHWRELWNSRNLQRHGVDEVQQKHKRMGQLHRELRALYIAKPRVRVFDRRIFKSSAEAHIDLGETHVSQWIRTFKKIIIQSMKEAMAGLASMDLRRYLIPRQSHNPSSEATDTTSTTASI